MFCNQPYICLGRQSRLEHLPSIKTMRSQSVR
jgi:hypothetical protein